MFCKNCGQKITKDAKFCKNCGSSSDGLEMKRKTTTVVAPKIGDSQENNEPNKLSATQIILLWAFVIIGFGLVISWIIYDSKQTSRVSGGSASDTPTASASATFYTQSVVNVRSCASKSCDNIGQYPANTSFILQYSSVNDLPDWVQVSWQDSDGITQEGYISKTLLGENQVSAQQNSTITQTQQTSSSVVDLPTIIQRWQKSTAYVECYWNYSSGGPWYYKQSGSGLLAILNSVPTVITNKHVVTNAQYGMATECDVGFPNNNHVFYSVTTVDQPAYKILPNSSAMTPDIPIQGKLEITSDGSDVAYLSDMTESSGQPSISLTHRAATGRFACDATPIGEPLVILGYPDYGTDAGSSVNVFSDLQVTATEGIISGQDSIYYTTSAKLEHGNSGGLAIDERNNCYIGIPTAFVSGQADSLGRILPASYAVSNN